MDASARARLTSALRLARAGWMAFAHALSRVTTPMIFGLLYFVLVTPMGFVRRTVGRSPLVRKGGQLSYWRPRPSPDEDEARRSMNRPW